MNALSFASLLAPIGPDEFFETYYERAPLIVHRGKSNYYGGLLTFDDVDRVLTTTATSISDVRIVDSTRSIGIADYSSDDIVDARRAFGLYATGATIVLNGMQKRLPRLAALCRVTEARINHKCETNLYLTPPNAQGFGAHHDTHDVFILQVAGTKQWQLYDADVQLPLAGQNYDPNTKAVGEPSATFLLEQGDLLYCPRGLIHSACSTNAASLHITLGVLAKTWADLMVEVVAAASLGDVEFRRSLPTGYALDSFDRVKIADVFHHLTARLADGPWFDTAFESLKDNFIITRSADMQGQLHQLEMLDKIGANTVVAPRSDLIYSLKLTGEEVLLLLPGQEIVFPKFVREAIVFSLAGDQFAVDQIPGKLDSDGKIVLVRRLVKEGLLYIVSHSN